MSPTFYDILIFVSGMACGGIVAGGLVWALMLEGADRIVASMVLNRGFTYLGRRYTVTPVGEKI